MARSARVARETGETVVKVELDLDGSGEGKVQTGLPFFDHMLQQLATHGLFDLKVSATGQDQHHKVEDVAIALGRALHQALGEKGVSPAWATPSSLWMRPWPRWRWTWGAGDMPRLTPLSETRRG